MCVQNLCNLSIVIYSANSLLAKAKTSRRTEDPPWLEKILLGFNLSNTVCGIEIKVIIKMGIFYQALGMSFFNDLLDYDMRILMKLYHSNLKSACPKTVAGLLTHKATPCLFLSHIFCLALQLPSSTVMALIAHTSTTLPWYSLFYKTSSSYGFVGLISCLSEILAWILKNIWEWNQCQVSPL